MEKHGRRRWPLVVLTSSPFHGHMTPILQLATTLHAKGFPIAISHSKFNPPNPSNLPSHFTFLPLSDNLPTMDDSGSFTSFLNDLNSNCKPSFKDHLTRLMSEGKYKSIVVIYDYVMFFAGDVAVDLNLAAIMLRSTSAAYLPAFFVRQQLRQRSRFLEQGKIQEMEEHGKTLVVLTSSPFHGHMTPILQLATTLDAKGFNIAIAHSKLNPPNPSNLPSDFIFLQLSDNIPVMDDSGSFTNFLKDINTNCKPSFKDHLTRLMSEGNYKSIVVVYDHVMFFAPDVALHLNLVAIMLRSSSAAFIPAFLARQQVRQQTRFLEQEFVMQEVVPNHHPFRYKDLPFHNSSIEDWQKICANFSQHARPSAVVWNTVQSLEHESLIRVKDYFQVPVFAVGPLHKITPIPSISLHKQDTSCITWLDKQPPKSVVYISFGSLAKMDAKVLTEMAWGLAKSNQRFLWAIRPGLVSGSDWLELLPDGFVEETRERGLIVKWAPQKEVLSHFAVGGFWSHCGWNSCLESISSGVVMICQPWSVDQGANARYVSYVWKIGLELEHVERGEIERMIRIVMVDDEGEEMRVRVNILKEMIKEAVENGGSSQNALEGVVEFILSC